MGIWLLSNERSFASGYADYFEELISPNIDHMCQFAAMETIQFKIQIGIGYLVIDEMQDYTPIQLAVLNRIYRCPKTILGDFGQVLNPCHLHSLDEIRELYPDARFVRLPVKQRSRNFFLSKKFLRNLKKVPANRLELSERPIQMQRNYMT